MKELDKNQRELIKKLAIEYFRDKYEVDINKFKSDVLDSNNIIYTEYSVPPGKGGQLVRFLKMMPEILVLRQESPTNWYCFLAANYHFHCVAVLKKAIAEKGKIYLGLIPEILKQDAGIDYKEYVGSSPGGLKKWLKTEFEKEFEIDADDYLLPLDESACEPVYPQSEIAQMHSLAFMSLWANNSRVLQAYTNSSKTADTWSNLVARGLANALLGVTHIYHYTKGEDIKIIFDTGIKTEAGNIIYCILHKNPANKSGTMQPYAIEGFCCPIEADDELSRELKQNIPEIVTKEDSDDKYTELENILEQLKAVQKELNSSSEALTECFRNGVAIAPDIFALIKQYADKWSRVDELMDYLKWKPDNPVDISFLSEQLESKNRKNDMLGKAVTAYKEAAEAILEYCRKCQLDEMCEAIERDIAFAENAGLDSCTDFITLVEYYIPLVEVIEQDKTSDEVVARHKIIEPHFPKELSPVILSWLFVGKKAEVDQIKSTDILTERLSEAKSLLSSLELSNYSEMEDGEEPDIDADALFNMCMDARNAETVKDIVLLVKKFPATQFERMIALGKYSEALALLNNEENKSLSDEVVSELESRAADNKDESTELSLYECGKRIQSIIGKDNRTAEKYFIAGLICDPDLCAKALIGIYAYSNPVEFVEIWKKYGDNISLSHDEFKYLLQVLSADGQETLKDFLYKHLYVFYVDEYADILSDTLKNFDYPDLRSTSASQLEYIRSLPPYNEFEIKITNSESYDGIKTYLNENKSLLNELGYTEQEQQTITTIIDIESANQDGDKSPAAKLYDMQKNKNGTVERMIWSSCVSAFNISDCILLLSILNEEYRFDESCLLYECYEDKISGSSAARRLYITALLVSKKDNVVSFICDNMQDYMNLVRPDSASRNMISDRVERLANDSDKDIAEFFSKIIYFHDYLDNSVLRSIITLSSELRDIATDDGLLNEFGLDPTQVENFSSIFRTDSYPRGRDVVHIAERLYKFIGSHKDAAETFARLALDYNYDAVSLLWNIVSETNDASKKLSILLQYPKTRVGREREYCSLLLQTEQYKEFLQESEHLSVGGAEIAMQTVIAKCNLNEDIGDITAELNGEIESVSFYWVVEMLETMCRFGLSSQAHLFIVEHFEEMLGLYTYENLQMAITANGRLSTEDLKAIQKIAHAKGNTKLCVYLYENYGIGRFKGASKEFLDEQLSLYEDGDTETKSNIADCIKKIYKNNSECISEIVLAEIECVLGENENDTHTIGVIEDIVRNVHLTAKGASALMEMLKPFESIISNELCKELARICRETQLEKECIEYFTGISGMMSGKNRAEFLYMLCGLYNDAFNDGYFDDAWFDCAKDVCEELLQTKHFCDAALCIYYIEKAKNNILRMKFILSVLADKRSELPPQIAEQIDNESQALSLNGETDIFDSFVEMANTSTMEEIVDYCGYCGKFIFNEGMLLKQFNEVLEQEKAGSYSIVASVILLKLLYCNPDNAEYWEKCARGLPLEENPVAYTKILYQACLKNNKETLWKKCINACESYCQEELLSDVLLDCARKAQIPYALQHLRTMLYEKANKNPLYFSQIENPDKRAELVSILCTRLKKDTINHDSHMAIQELATIAVHTDSIKAFEIMMESLGGYLFKEYCNLGFMVACRLMLRKRFEEAQMMIKQLEPLVTTKYRVLIGKLAQMDLSELMAWSSETVNNQLIKMILPLGNYPKIGQINDFALSCMVSGNAEEGASLICELIANDPTDYGSYMALFMLCKELPHRIDLLHKALCGLIQNSPIINSATYYIRKRKDYAVLLANVNAVIIAQKKAEEIRSYDDYDFRISAKEYYCRYESHYNVAVLEEIEDAQNNIQNALMNLPDMGLDIMCNVALSFVTGNWFELLVKCYRENINIGQYMSVYSNLNDGFARSVLRAVYSLSENERGSFIIWLKASIPDDGAEQLSMALHLYEENYYGELPLDLFEGDILRLPFEEYSVIESTFRSTIRQLTSKSTKSVHSAALIVAYLSHLPNSLSEFWENAMRCFEASNDRAANGLFAALREISHEYGYSHKIEKHTQKNPERYEALERISGVFAGIEEFISKVSDPDFHSWSCINMVLALLVTPRANEVERLKQYFAESNRNLVDVILIIINPNKSDSDKLTAVSALSDEVSRGLIFFVIKTAGHAFVKEKGTIETIVRIHNHIASRYPTVFRNNGFPYKFLLVEPYNINENAYKQLPVDGMVKNYEVVEPAVISSSTESELSFVASLTPSETTDGDIDKLWAEHESIKSFGLENYGLRLELSKQIYRIALAKNAGQTELNDYALRYGVDYYYYCMGNKDYDMANKLIKEMVVVYDPAKNLEGYKMLKDVVCNTALHELLNRGYTSIRSMAADYAEHKSAFVRMRDMLSASTMPEELNDVNSIYAALEIVVKCFAEISPSHTSALREALRSAQKQVYKQSASTTAWDNIKSSVRQMIQDEINKIDQRPRLSVEVLSEDVHEYIYGQVKNVGNATAENINIQFEYNTEQDSPVYTLRQLEKGETAAFEIKCPTQKDAVALSYSIRITYGNKGETYNDTKEGSVTIRTDGFQDFDSDLYITGGPVSDFSISDNGNVESKNFFGRKEEKQKIRSLFAGENFASYKSVIIYGMRRVGKTSMLHYLVKYAEANCTDAVTRLITYGGNYDFPIQEALIDPVIYECKTLNAASIPKERWDEFENKWKRKENEGDRRADELQYFYRELKELNGGKGLILVIDEFDILIEEVEKKQGVDSVLFAGLRTLLNNVYCQESVCLVICGSNKLVRYMDGGKLNQFFQQFGDNFIEIGRLTNADMNDMLEKPYEEKYPFVNLKPALSWIWKYSGGLAWYAKLLGNAALAGAKEHKRNTVYPTDVVDALTTVTSNGQYFRQINMSCRPDELKVLDVMQSLTATATEYISLPRLMEVLAGDFSQREVESIMNTLEGLQILQRNPYDRYSYKFELEVYWHHFRAEPSNYYRVDEIPSRFKEERDLSTREHNDDENI